MKISILSNFKESSSKSFVFPIMLWEKHLNSLDIKISFFTKVYNKIYDTDILIIDSNFYRGKRSLTKNKVDKELQLFSKKIKTLIWYDLSDSSALDNPWPLEYVSLYLKNQILIDREKYLTSIKSSGRVFSDYYISKKFVQESNSVKSIPIKNKELLHKLRLGWNSAIYDGSRLNNLSFFLRKEFQIKNLVKYIDVFQNSKLSRNNDFFTRFNLDYSKESISWHRTETLRRLKNNFSNIRNKKIDYQKYMSELKDSKIVISPFGWGEFAYRDYETFILGSLLMKPDMSHMSTWPNLYIENETYIPYSWNLDNLIEQINNILFNDEMRISIAETGQANLKKYTIGNNAHELFCNRFLKIIESSNASRI